MALTTEQLAERKKGIGASDAPRIISGNWLSLFNEKTGRAESEDLTWVFPVQLGSVTEELNLRFAEHALGVPIVDRGLAVISVEHPYMRCTLDGSTTIDGIRTVVEAKHVNGFSKIEDVRAKYVPQVTHQMVVCEMKRAILSVIIGTSEPVLELIELDEFFANEYIEKCAEFWNLVASDTPPAAIGVAVDAPPPPKELMRVVSMDGNNAWASAANDYLSHLAANKLWEKADKDLRSMVDPDVREATGYGIKASRSKTGRLTIKGVKA